MNTKTKDRLATGGAVVAIAGLAAFMALTFGPLLNLTGTDTPSNGTPAATDPSLFRGVGDAPEHSPTPTPTPEPVVELPLPPALPDPEPVEEAPVYEPTLCPEGTVAGSVDGDGNESNCQPPCASWADTDGDGTAETCVPYQSGRDPEWLGSNA